MRQPWSTCVAHQESGSRSGSGSGSEEAEAEETEEGFERPGEAVDGVDAAGGK